MVQGGGSVLWSVEQHRPFSPFCAILSKIRAEGLVYRKYSFSLIHSLMKNGLLRSWGPACTVNIKPLGTKMAAGEQECRAWN